MVHSCRLSASGSMVTMAGCCGPQLHALSWDGVICSMAAHQAQFHRQDRTAKHHTRLFCFGTCAMFVAWLLATSFCISRKRICTPTSLPHPSPFNLPSRQSRTPCTWIFCATRAVLWHVHRYIASHLPAMALLPLTTTSALCILRHQCL